MVTMQIYVSENVKAIDFSIDYKTYAFSSKSGKVRLNEKINVIGMTGNTFLTMDISKYTSTDDITGLSKDPKEEAYGLGSALEIRKGITFWSPWVISL